VKEQRNGTKKAPIRGDEVPEIERILRQGSNLLEVLGQKEMRIITLERALAVAVEELKFCRDHHPAVVKGR
jgi:hypothetical protein